MTTKLNKHQLRTQQTRELLLRAAEKVFVRDGYEGAELGEIAAMAGRTKGAIYAQFKSKEDIFLALIKEWGQRQRAQMEELLKDSRSTEQTMQAYRKFCVGVIDDPTWSLLLLEFKLFAIRHPESKEQLRKYYGEVFSRIDEKRLVGFLGAAGAGALSRSVAVQTLQPLLSALAVEASFAPGLLDRAVLKKVAARIFDALMQAPPE